MESFYLITHLLMSACATVILYLCFAPGDTIGNKPISSTTSNREPAMPGWPQILAMLMFWLTAMLSITFLDPGIY